MRQQQHQGVRDERKNAKRQHEQGEGQQPNDRPDDSVDQPEDNCDAQEREDLITGVLVDHGYSLD
jgi:hypothetical protein